MKKKIAIGICSLLSLGLATNLCLALQIKPVTGNQTVSAYYSEFGKTRIFVKGDRIQSINGTPNAYRYQNNNRLGQVFIMPTLTYHKKPFSLFVTTQSGQTYGLNLKPRSVLSANIMLKPPRVVSPQARHWEDTSPYAQMIVRLIRNMVNHRTPTGYQVDNESLSPPTYLDKNCLKVQLQQIYQGDHIIGAVYQLTNRLNFPLKIQSADFYKTGLRAIALSSRMLIGHGQSLLFEVFNHG